MPRVPDFARGPLELLVPGEILAPIPEPDFAAFVAGRLAGLSGADVTLGGAFATVADTVSSSPIGALDATLARAAAEHGAQTGTPPPDFGAERANADATEGELGSLASSLPPESADPDLGLPGVPNDDFVDAGGWPEGAPGGPGLPIPPPPPGTPPPAPGAPPPLPGNPWPPTAPVARDGSGGAEEFLTDIYRGYLFHDLPELLGRGPYAYELAYPHEYWRRYHYIDNSAYNWILDNLILPAQ
jgi:hypothetical protein